MFCTARLKIKPIRISNKKNKKRERENKRLVNNPGSVFNIITNCKRKKLTYKLNRLLIKLIDKTKSNNTS